MRKSFSVIAGIWLACSLLLVSAASGASSEEKILEVLQTEAAPPEPLLPPDFKIEETFQKGAGPAVGSVQMVVGEALVVHSGEQKTAYRLTRDQQVFDGDLLVTLERSRVRLMMDDKSLLALAPQSKLLLEQTSYDPAREQRDSRLELFFGRVRSTVAKVQGEPNYLIRTPTATCGVRGSDFALAVAPQESTEQRSGLARFLAFLDPVPEAQAATAAPVPLITALVTGEATTVSFAGTVGAAQIVGPFSVSAAAMNAAAVAPVVVGPAAAGSVLNSVGPSLASMSMPPEFD